MRNKMYLLKTKIEVKENITIQENAKKDFMELMKWTEKDFERNTIDISSNPKLEKAVREGKDITEMILKLGEDTHGN